MDIDLAYDGSILTITLPDSVTVDRFAPMEVTTPYTYDRFLTDFESAHGRRLLDVARPVLIVNDAQRNTPTPLILDWLDRIDPAFLDRVSVVISTGTHATPSDADFDFIFGKFLSRLESRIHTHVSTDIDSMVEVGTDRFDEAVYLNRQVDEADCVGVIGSVEPHYFAGYTGGRKGVFPGVTDQATIARNHNLANSLEAAPLRLMDNPVAEHLDELMGLIDGDKFFGFQIVHDEKRTISRVYMGTLADAFETAVDEANSIYTAGISDQYDAVICEVRPPLDRSLYQLQKALENNQAAVRDGGEAILVSACRDGVGSEHFYNLASDWNRKTNAPKNGQLHFGSHKLSRVNLMARRIGIRLYSTLADDEVRHVFYEPLDDIQSHLTEICKGPVPKRLAIVHDAGNMVLRA